LRGVSGKYHPVGMVWYFYKLFAFLVLQTWYGMYKEPRWFLNENDIEETLCF